MFLFPKICPGLWAINRLQLILIYMNQKPRFFGFKEITNCVSRKVGMEGKGPGCGVGGEGGRENASSKVQNLCSPLSSQFECAWEFSKLGEGSKRRRGSCCIDPVVGTHRTWACVNRVKTKICASRGFSPHSSSTHLLPQVLAAHLPYVNAESSKPGLAGLIRPPT